LTSAARLADGTVLVWGYNENGQLGIGGHGDLYFPYYAGLLSGTSQLSFGGGYGLANR
jgi:alpha-tubulin suppressor-like RCC1 family protein